MSNEVSNLVPEIWAQESLVLLEEKMTLGNLVYRDFSEEIAAHGDTVNADKPKSFEAKRKEDGDDIVIQDAKSDKIPVLLDQHVYTSFMIYDGQRSKSMKDLMAYFLNPAIVSIARGVDHAVNGIIPSFTNTYGRLGTLDSANAVDYLVETNAVADDLNWGEDRNMMLTAQSRAKMMLSGQLTTADKTDDNGLAVVKGFMYERYGINMYMAQNTPHVRAANAPKVEGAVDNLGGYAIGETDITVDGLSAAIAVGAYVTFAGSTYPYRVTGTTGGATPTEIVIDKPLKDAIVDNAIVSVYKTATTSSAYAAGYSKEISVAGLTSGQQPKAGTPFAIGSDIYTVQSIIALTATTATILPNRPIVSTVGSGDVVSFYPVGDYNFCFVKEAIALVTRPLELPSTNLVDAFVASYNNLAIRVVFAYDARKQGTLCTVDLLCGVKQLDNEQGILVLG